MYNKHYILSKKDKSKKNRQSRKIKKNRQTRKIKKNRQTRKIKKNRQSKKNKQFRKVKDIKLGGTYTRHVDSHGVFVDPNSIPVATNSHLVNPQAAAAAERNEMFNLSPIVKEGEDFGLVTHPVLDPYADISKDKETMHNYQIINNADTDKVKQFLTNNAAPTITPTYYAPPRVAPTYYAPPRVAPPIVAPTYSIVHASPRVAPPRVAPPLKKIKTR